MIDSKIYSLIAKASSPGERINCPAFNALKEQDEFIINNRVDSWNEVLDKSSFSAEKILKTHSITTEQLRQSVLDVEVVDKQALPKWAKNFHYLISSWRDIIKSGADLHNLEPFTKNIKQELFGSNLAIIAKSQLNESITILKKNNIILHDKGIANLLNYFTSRIYSPIISIASSYYHYSQQTERADYNSFEAWTSLLEKQPVIAKVIGVVNSDWLEVSCEMLIRFNNDIADIRKTFLNDNSNEKLEIIDISPGLGDPHRGGRSVAIIKTNLGDVVYKPKNLSGTDAIGTLLEKLHKLEPNYMPLAPKFINKGDYGWEQKVNAKHCSDKKQVSIFYQRLGAWLRLLQVLNANDFWYDNLIASADMPYFIDYETIIGAPLFGINTALNSLNTIGILPRIMPSKSNEDPIDISCMVPPGMQRTPIESSYPSDKKESKNLSLKAIDFASFLNGEFQDIKNYWPNFQAGFIKMNQLLMSNAGEVAINDFIDNIKESRFRSIFIDTWSAYSLITNINKRSSNDGVRRSIAHDSLFNYLAYYKFEIIDSAIQSIKRNDIPIYELRANTTDAYTHDNTIVKNVFTNTPVSYIKENLSRLDRVEDDLDIAGSLFSLRNNDLKTDYSISNKIDNYKELEVANQIGKYLLSLFVDKDYAFGINNIMLDSSSNYKSLMPLVHDFYGASALIILFSYLYDATGDKEYLTALEKLWGFINVDNIFAKNIGYGWFNRYTAMINSYTILAKYFDVSKDIKKCYQLLTDDINKDNYITINYGSGITGLLSVLASTYKKSDYTKDCTELLSQKLSNQKIIEKKYSPWLEGHMTSIFPDDYWALELAKSYWQENNDLHSKLANIKLTKSNKLTSANLTTQIYLKSQSQDNLRASINKLTPQNLDLADTRNILDSLYHQLYFKKYFGQKMPELKDLSLALINRFNANKQWFCDSWASDKHSISAIHGLVDISLAFLAQHNDNTILNPARLNENTARNY